MAIWAEIKKAINSDFSKPLNELINEAVGTTNATGGTVTSGSLMAKLNAIIGGTPTKPRKPTKMASGEFGQTAVTGSGKGELWIFCVNGAVKHTIIIDGVTMLNAQYLNDTGFIFKIEFTSSFSIKADHASYPSSYIAVFY